ncbi:MAG TPA: amino acid racemase [Micromonosporaceae bacterium]|nr:amino acid racemase [Micromonosporaceae bacterium]
MRHVGIAAHSIEGASLCFREFCHEGFAELGPNDHPDVTMDAIALARSLPSWDSGDHAAIRQIMATSIARLAGAGAEFFVCPDNTVHTAFELPGPDFALPGLHIAEIVADRAARDGRQRVGILGTRYLTDGPVYPRAFASRGIEAVLPSADDRAIVNRVIFDELTDGIVTNASRTAYIGIIERLAARGCDAVALVCTEIPLLITPDVSPLPTLDSTRLLAHAAFEVAIGRSPVPMWRGGPIRSA